MNRYVVLNVLIAIGLVASVAGIDCNNQPVKTDLKECCAYQGMISKEVHDKCEKYLDGDNQTKKHDGPGGHHPHPPACYMECAMNETKLMVNGDFDEVKLKEYLSTLLAEVAEVIPVAQKAFKTCMEKMKNPPNGERPPPPPPPSGQETCNPHSAIMMHCVFMDILFNCPTSVWSNTDTCNNNRDFIKNCHPRGKPPH